MKAWWNAQVEKRSAQLCKLLSTPEGRRFAGRVVQIVVVTHLIAWAWRILA
jgi:hypothetical protein